MIVSIVIYGTILLLIAILIHTYAKNIIIRGVLLLLSVFVIIIGHNCTSAESNTMLNMNIQSKIESIMNKISDTKIPISYRTVTSKTSEVQAVYNMYGMKFRDEFNSYPLYARIGFLPLRTDKTDISSEDKLEIVSLIKKDFLETYPWYEIAVTENLGSPDAENELRGILFKVRYNINYPSQNIN